MIFPHARAGADYRLCLVAGPRLGEYGSVVFVSGNMPFKTEIAPVLIVARLEEFAYAEATAIAVVLLVISFAMLIADQPAGTLEPTLYA